MVFLPRCSVPQAKTAPNGWAGVLVSVLPCCCRKGASLNKASRGLWLNCQRGPSSTFAHAWKPFVSGRDLPKVIKDRRVHGRPGREFEFSREQSRTIAEAAIQLGRRPDRIPPFSLIRTLRAFLVRFLRLLSTRASGGRAIDRKHWTHRRRERPSYIPLRLPHMQKPNTLTKKT